MPSLPFFSVAFCGTNFDKHLRGWSSLHTVALRHAGAAGEWSHWGSLVPAGGACQLYTPLRLSTRTGDWYHLLHILPFSFVTSAPTQSGAARAIVSTFVVRQRSRCRCDSTRDARHRSSEGCHHPPCPPPPPGPPPPPPRYLRPAPAFTRASIHRSLSPGAIALKLNTRLGLGRSAHRQRTEPT